MSFVTTTLWLAVALYLAMRLQPIFDFTEALVLRGLSHLVPKPTNRIRLAAEWAWWQLTRTK